MINKLNNYNKNMGKKFMRKKSKRTTTRQVQKQEKKLREHNAKVRKEKRKNPKKFSKSKKVIFCKCGVSTYNIILLFNLDASDITCIVF